MVICASYMHEFSVSKDMEKKFNNDKRRREVAIKKVAAHLCLTLIIKELIFSVVLSQCYHLCSGRTGD